MYKSLGGTFQPKFLINYTGFVMLIFGYISSKLDIVDMGAYI